MSESNLFLQRADPRLAAVQLLRLNQQLLPHAPQLLLFVELRVLQLTSQLLSILLQPAQTVLPALHLCNNNSNNSLFQVAEILKYIIYQTQLISYNYTKNKYYKLGKTQNTP